MGRVGGRLRGRACVTRLTRSIVHDNLPPIEVMLTIAGLPMVHTRPLGAKLTCSDGNVNKYL
jgi:hypothetical protein